MSVFKRILVASDLTEQSIVALEFARSLADDASAALIVLHVVPMPAALKSWAGPEFRRALAHYRDMLDCQTKASQVELETQARAAGLDVERTRLVVRAGAPATMIATVADTLEADLIIVGRGSGGRLGPVAEHTTQLAGRTVLVAPVNRMRSALRRIPVSTRRPGVRIRA